MPARTEMIQIIIMERLVVRTERLPSEMQAHTRTFLNARQVRVGIFLIEMVHNEMLPIGTALTET